VRANASIPISNIDITPTVASALCLAPKGDAYRGTTLMQQAPRERMLVVPEQQ